MTMSEKALNPQAEPPGRNKIDLGDLTETVTLSVRRVLEERQVGTGASAFRNPRIIIGIILEPPYAELQQ
jgi:hypothetical protein